MHTLQGQQGQALCANLGRPSLLYGGHYVVSRVGSFDPKSEKKQPMDQIENVASSEMVLLLVPHPSLRPPVIHLFIFFESK